MRKLLVAILLLFAIRTHAQTVDAKFLVVNGALVAVASTDYLLTQHCLHTRQCNESNALLPKSPAGMAAVIFGTTAASIAFSYYSKRGGSIHWWIAPTIGIGAHTVGAASGMRFIF